MERHRIATKKYRENNPEKWQEVQKRWLENHPNAKKEYRNKPEVKERQRINHLIRKYGEVALVVLERDNYTCQKCGKKEAHIHHIDWDKTNNIPENMIVLCNSCHRVLHLWIPVELRRIIFERWMQTPLEETAVYLKSHLKE